MQEKMRHRQNCFIVKQIYSQCLKALACRIKSLRIHGIGTDQKQLLKIL
jgi:hypothetical protein